MTDAQIFTIAMSVILQVAMLIYSNRGLADSKETLRADLRSGFARMSSEIQSLRTHLK